MLNLAILVVGHHLPPQKVLASHAESSMLVPQDVWPQGPPGDCCLAAWCPYPHSWLWQLSSQNLAHWASIPAPSMNIQSWAVFLPVTKEIPDETSNTCLSVKPITTARWNQRRLLGTSCAFSQASTPVHLLGTGSLWQNHKVIATRTAGIGTRMNYQTLSTVSPTHCAQNHHVNLWTFSRHSISRI